MILNSCLYFLLKWLNPIISFTCEEVFQILKKINLINQESIFLIDFKKIDYSKKINFDLNKFNFLKSLKIEVNQAIEDLRNDKKIKSSLEVQVFIKTSEKNKIYFNNIDLEDFFICSGVNFNKLENYKDLDFKKVSSIDDVHLYIKKAEGNKCNHCWKVKEVPCDRLNCAIQR